MVVLKRLRHAPDHSLSGRQLPGRVSRLPRGDAFAPRGELGDLTALGRRLRFCGMNRQICEI